MKNFKNIPNSHLHGIFSWGYFMSVFLKKIILPKKPAVQLDKFRNHSCGCNLILVGLIQLVLLTDLAIFCAFAKFKHFWRISGISLNLSYFQDPSPECPPPFRIFSIYGHNDNISHF